MDVGGSWRPTQGSDPAAVAAAAGGIDPNAPAPAGGDWRSQLQSEARSRIVNKIMETLKKHLPVSVPDGLNELQKIAIRFEEKIYTAATSQSDYLRKISLKMISMETKTQQNPGNAHVIQNQNPTGPGKTIRWMELLAEPGHSGPGLVSGLYRTEQYNSTLSFQLVSDDAQQTRHLVISGLESLHGQIQSHRSPTSKQTPPSICWF